MTRSVSWIGFWSAIMLYWRYVEVLIFVCYFQYMYFNWTWKLRQQFKFQKNEKHHVDSALDEIKFWENPQRAYTQPQLSHWVYSLGCVAGFVSNVRVPTPGIVMLPSPLGNQPWLHVKKIWSSQHDLGRKGISIHLFFYCRIIINGKTI